MLRAITIAVFAGIIAILSTMQVYSSNEKVKPKVGVYYFPGWYRQGGASSSPSTDWSEWRGAVMKAAVPRPLCGFYNDADPRLWNYYIPWMTSHGTDFIAFDWYYNAGQEYLCESLDRGFMQSEKFSDIDFCVHWCNHGGGWFIKPLDQTKAAILEMTDLLCARYFHRPNYLRMEGKPVFMIYDINMLLGFGGGDAVKDALGAMRTRMKQKGFPGVYLVAVYSGSSPEYIARLKSLGFDAFTAYTYCWMRPPSVMWDSKTVPYSDQVDTITDTLYPQLAKTAKAAGIPYWPTTYPGWDDRPRAGLENAYVLIDNTPEHFEKMLRGALKYVNPSSPVVMVEAWNEWGEGACIEPAKGHGFGYLKAMASAFGRNKPDERVPSASEISSWSILTPEELKVAKENESKPWPVKDVKWYKLGKSYESPKVKMPYVFDLTSNGISTDQLGVNEATVKEQTAEGTWFETTGGDPMIVLPKLLVPMDQIRKITIEGRIDRSGQSDDIESYKGEIYWETGLMPEFTPFASSPFTWQTTGDATIEADDVSVLKNTGTPMLRLRIDPCSKPNVRVLIKRVVFYGNYSDQ